MLPVEQEPIKIPRVDSEVEVADGKRVRYLRTHDGAPVELTVPRRYLFLWDQVRMGASLYDLSLRMRARGFGPRIFLEVSSFLTFLVDHDLVEDVRLVRMADSIRGEYEWPEDFIQSFSIGIPLAQWARRGSRSNGFRASVFSQAFDFSLLVAVAVSLPAVVFAIHYFYGFLSKSSHLEPFVNVFLWDYVLAGVLVGLIFAGTVGRSFAAALRLTASRLGFEAGETEIRIDLFGPHLSFQPLTVTGGLRRSADFILVFSSVVPVLLALVAVRQFNWIPFTKLLPSAPALLMFLSGGLFVAALSAHPMTKSALTRSLRVWNRTPLVWREDDELKEVETFHQLGIGISHTLMLASLVASGVLAGLSWGGGSRRLASLAALGSGLFMVFIYLEPILANHLPTSARLNRRRRMWATKTRVLDVASADREAWAELPVLRQLTAPIRAKLLTAARVVEFRAGQAVCRQGGTDRSLFIVLEGKLGVAKSFEGRRRKVVAILASGSAFGETAFFFGMPRTADVVAMETSRLLEIPYFEAMKNLDLSSSEEFQFRVWLLQALSGNPMLKDLPSEAMDTLIFAGRRKTFRAGEVVFTEGAPADCCYFIAQGRASAVQQAKKINEMGAGDAFGEIALLRTGVRRTATVVADSDLLCMELDVESFWALLAARLPLGAEIERLALRRLKADEARRSQER
jgi:CRP-like cAMP-binding protein